MAINLALAVLLIGIAAWQIYLTLAWYCFVNTHSTPGGRQATGLYELRRAVSD